MVPVRPTGTRDEYYDLISALYHALKGADVCNTYASDAEAAGRAEHAEFFRETQGTYAGVAERAKELLGVSEVPPRLGDRKSTRLNSSHANISYAVFCLKKK